MCLLPEIPAPLSFFLRCLLLGLAGGCAGGAESAPSASVGERAVEQAIRDHSAGRIHLLDYRRTDATSAEMFGVRMHEQDYEAELEFTEDCSWMLGFKNGGFETKPADYGMGTAVTRGQRVRVRGSVEFVRSDSGWQVRRVECDAAR